MAGDVQIIRVNSPLKIYNELTGKCTLSATTHTIKRQGVQ